MPEVQREASRLIPAFEATYAKSWKLLGKMTAEEPPSDEANGH